MDGINYDADKESLNYDIYEEQSEVIESFISADYDIVEFRAGNRSGKTIAGARALIYAAFMYSGTEYVAISYSTDQGRKSTWKAIFENLPECDADNPSESPIIDYYNATSKKLKFTNGSIIWLSTAGAGDDALVGSELNGVWLDESDYMDNVYELIDEGLKRQSKRPAYGIISTSTPDPNQNKFNSAYYSVVEQQEHPQTGDTLNYNIKTVHASIFDNPFISDEKKEEYRRRHNHNADTVLHGGFSAGNDSMVYDRFNLNEHVIESIEDIEFRDVHLYGYDAGYRHARVVLHVRVTVNNQYIIVDEFYKHESTAQDAIQWLKSKPKGIIYSEHARGDMKEFRRKLNGFSVKKADKSIQAGIDSVRNRLVPDRNDIVGLKVLASCDNTISEFQTYAEDEINSVSGGDDAMDTVRYIVHSNSGRYVVTDDDTSGSSRSVGFSTNEYENRGRRNLR